MSGVEPEKLAIDRVGQALGEGDEASLRAGFRQFVAAAARLEASHARLVERAERIDRELAMTNAKLADALSEHEGLLGALPVGVVIERLGEHGGDALLESANAAAERLFGETVSEQNAERLRTGGGSRDIDVDGVPVRVQEATMLDGSRLFVVEDRSTVRHLEREVDRLDRLAGLSELALGIAHEIKNPLHGVMGFADLIDRAADRGDVDKTRRYARHVHDGLQRVDAIVRALLAFARPSTSDRHEEVVIEEVVRTAAASAGVPTASIRCDYKGDAAALLVPAGPLVRVLANLFGNAAEALSQSVDEGSEDAGTTLELAVVAIENDGVLELVVEDNGPGVPAELADRIFEPFVSSKTTGHGLGLPLASRVLAYLGGNVRLDNPGERGARFSLSVPARREEAR